VRDRAARRPVLLAVDDEMIARILSTRLERGQVRPRIGFRIELAPDFLGRQDLLEVALLLRFRAVHDDRGPDEADAETVDRRWRARARHLVLHERPLHRCPPAAAALLRPQHPDVTGVVQRAMPRLALRAGLLLQPWRLLL